MREQMNIVIVGHVDHGKSTVIGRLLADTDSLPEGKLEQVKEKCKRESKTFEYAFLLDALKDEQSQGITIDSARCFFKTKKRDYIIIDAPGHIEFLKNMISGAARAEAALLVIDANEGVKENSKRHGYMLSMLGINQVIVAINKMDLVDYKKEVYDKIVEEYKTFLKQINIQPKEFIPVSALEGDNIAENTVNLDWYKGNNILSSLDLFKKQKAKEDKPFRMPVQDVYRFTDNDNRRIVAGRVLSGRIKIGDNIVFFPSNKRSTISSIEGFSIPKQSSVKNGYSTGFTLTEQIYVNRGDIMCKETEQLPHISSEIKASIFWMGMQPMLSEKTYKLKLGTQSIPCKIKEINNVLDASSLDNEKKQEIDRHEVAEVILTLQSPIVFDTIEEIQETGRFVIVDEYEIAGGGIITEALKDELSPVREKVFQRDQKWDSGIITQRDRAAHYGQTPKMILITGPTGIDKKGIAKHLEKSLFNEGRKVYFLGIRNILRGLDADVDKEKREEHIRRLAEVSHLMLDAGLIVVATASDLTTKELKTIQTIIFKDNLLVITLGEKEDKNGLVALKLQEDDIENNVKKVIDMLRFKGVLINV